MASTINASTSSGIVQTADTSGVLQLQTANTNAVTIDASQNVAVGNTTAYAKLYVKSSTSDGSTYGFDVDNSNGNALFQVATDGTTIFRTGSGTPSERMRIFSTGNVSIGTTTDNPLGNGGTQKTLAISGGSGYGAISIVSTATADGSLIGGLNFGSSSASSQQTTASINCYLTGSGATNASGYLSFYTRNGANFNEAMRIDSSGNVGIGNASQGNNKLYVQTPSGQYGVSYPVQAWGYAGHQIFNAQMDGSVNPIFNTDPESYWSPAATMIWQYRGSEKMRIDSSGNLLIGCTTGAAVGLTLWNQVTNGPGIPQISMNKSLTGTQTAVYFQHNSSAVGTITFSNTATAYNTSSDYRLKDNIQPITGALDKVSKLKPVTYTWKADNSQAEGFIAHELSEVCPLAVHGEKDEVDKDGNPVYQGIDTSKLVATLTAAIQELNAKVTALEAQLGAK